MNKINKLIQNLTIIFKKYTLVLASSLSMAITAIILIEDKDISEAAELILVKILIASGLGISLFFGLYMFSQRYGKRLVYEAIGLVLLGLFYFLLPHHKDSWNVIQIIMIFSSAVLTHLFVAFAPFWNTEKENPFWQYNKSLFIGLVQTWIFTQVMVAGVLLAVAAVENLFGIDFKEKIYPQLAVFIGVFGSAVIFLLFQQSGLEKMQAENPYPIVLKFFTQFILIPLLLLYGVILYLYMFKILINFNLPHGWVSYMVLAYSIFGMLALLLVHPLRVQGAKSWVHWFHRIFFYTLIPLIILLFVAINTRLLQYGFTEARCFVLLTAVWLAGMVCYFLFFKKTHIKIIPISLFLILACSLIVPYFNVFSVSVRSQENDLKKLLTENKLLVNGKIDFNKKIVDSVAENIEDKFEYLSDRLKYDALKSYLNDDVLKSFKNQTHWNIQGMFRNKIETKENYSSTQFALYSKNSYFKTEGYEYVLLENQLYNKQAIIGKDQFSLDHSNEYYKITLNNKHSIDLLPQIKDKFKPFNTLNGSDTIEDLSVRCDLENYSIKIQFSSINKSIYSNRENFYFDNAVCFIKIK